MDASTWFDDRDYSPRPQWVWDRDVNPYLTEVATLLAHLNGDDDLPRIVDDWLAGFNPGGVAIDVENHDEGLTVSFISGGQDALESLEFAVADFREAVLRPHPHVSVWWVEQPLQQ